MNFADVDRRYAELWQMYQAGALNTEQFDQQLRTMMIQDDQGRWWAKARESGEWHYYDQASGTWLRAAPPAAAPANLPAAPATTPEPQAAWAPARTATNTSITGATPATQGQQNPAQGYVAPTSYGAVSASAVGASATPELSSGLKVVFYILSFFFGLIGIILFFVYRSKPATADRAAARIFLLLGVLSLLLSCLCTVSYVALFSAAIFQF